jgi:predicted LPLAT superfamily acyltransferase/uncharacterized membrane protein
VTSDAKFAAARPVGRPGERAANAKTGRRTLRAVSVILAASYPFLVYFGLLRFGTRQVALFLLVALALRAGLAAALLPVTRNTRERLRKLAVDFAPVLLLTAAGGLTADYRFLLALPALVNVGMLIVFWRSLGGTASIVEEFARITGPDLSVAERRYCRSVTGVWCVFFALNGLVSAVLALVAPISWWTLYTGFLAYLLVGTLFGVEFAVRRYRFRRFGNGFVDRLLESLYDRSSGEEGATADESWMSVREKGSVFGVRLILFACRVCGRPFVRMAMRIVAAYYVASDRNLRRISRDFMRRVGRPTSLTSVYRHVRNFAYCATDRIFLLRGDTHLFDITRLGHEHVERLRREGRGAIAIGAHFGSYEALRAAAEHDDVPLSIVAWFENTGISYAVYESLAPELAARVIPLRPGRVDHLLEVRRRVQDGELVAFLGDRVVPGGETVEVDFLGSPARFPTGAFSVAAALGCPVLLIFNVYREPNRYELHCEPFAERIELPRRGAIEHKRAIVQRFATRLEGHVRSAPENWFNFYDFWS